MMQIQIPDIIKESLFEKYQDYRYICLFGGRGSGKSWGVADFLLLKSLERKVRILCTREYQSSIKDSVHKLLTDRIETHGLNEFFNITRDSIRSVNGSEFIFKGLALHIEEIKSTEGIDFCWVEEAEKVEADHWETLTPTIRKENSKILITFNPEDEENATYIRFVKHKSDDTLTVKVNYDKNPFFPEVLRLEMEYDKQYDYEKYLWKWEGNPRKFNDAVIFKNKWEEQDFKTSENARFYHGADWGFANDPSVLIRCYTENGYLYIDREVYGVGVELDELPEFFDNIETARDWLIIADSSRPETISHMQRKGFLMRAAKKQKDCIKDGIEKLKSFKKIIVHPRCKHTIDELKSYQYKKDKNTGEVLPIIIDANNHCMDALRYAIEDLVVNKIRLVDIV